VTTALGTALGTRLGTALADYADPGPSVPTIATLLPLHRYRASAASTSGGNLVSVPNQGSAGGSLTMTTGTLAAPVAEAAVNNASVITFTGSQEMRSTLPASAFNFLHNGVGCTTVMVAVPGPSIVAVGTAALAAHTGARLVIATTAVTYFFTNGSATVASRSVAGTNTGIGTSALALTSAASSPDSTLYKNGVLGSSGDFTVTPSSGDATQTLTVGRYILSGTFSSGRLAELLYFDRILSVAELAVLDAELFATYGVRAYIP